ncbi:MAG: methyltransferase type 11 [Deltaproteobacteria bacterium RIFCSPHIGHO2_02_FULL_50_15]|nr:MAG: methyltransferase type 11 [Deltaproteobacteria bacterium RIFCSPHIGHO2_02_FULL_50_15]
MTKPNYIPALRFNWLTNYYDWLASTFLPEKKFKTQLLLQAKIESGHHILDFGTGTATLSIMAKQMCPDIEIKGIDVDAHILSLAHRKVQQAQVSVDLSHYEGNTLPYPDASFDRVISSLVFHHLNRKQKLNAFSEIRRVLKPNGELHIADWGKPSNVLMRTIMFLDQWLDGYASTIDNVKGLLPQIITETGFPVVKQTKIYNTLAGTLCLYSAKK